MVTGPLAAPAPSPPERVRACQRRGRHRRDGTLQRDRARLLHSNTDLALVHASSRPLTSLHRATRGGGTAPALSRMRPASDGDLRRGRLIRDRLTADGVRYGKLQDRPNMRAHGCPRRIPLRQFVRSRAPGVLRSSATRDRARAAPAVSQRFAGGGAGPRPRVARRRREGREYSPATRCPKAPNRWLRPTRATSSAGSRRNSATAARCCSAR